MGRKSEYTQKIADIICARLAEGESLLAICRDDNMPSDATVRTWALEDRNGFSSHYARAREIGYEKLSDQLLEIADTPCIGIKTTTKESGVETVEGDMIEHRRLRVDTRKWMLSKMLPKKYGDKLAIGGADDLPPIKTMADEELEKKIAQLMAKNDQSNAG